MSYSRNFAINLGIAGLTLNGKYLDTAGAQSGSTITTGFVEIGNGLYSYVGTIADSFRGTLLVYKSTDATIFAAEQINPEGDAENTDAKTSAVKTKTDFLPSVTAGAAGGLLIAGSNAATTFATLTSTGALTINGTALNAANLDTTVSSRGTSTLTQAQVTGGAYAINSTSFSFASALDFTSTQKTSLNAATPTVYLANGTHGGLAASLILKQLKLTNTDGENAIDITANNGGNGINIASDVGNGINITAGGNGIFLSTSSNAVYVYSNGSAISLNGGGGYGLEVLGAFGGISVQSQSNAIFIYSGGASGISIQSPDKQILLTADGSTADGNIYGGITNVIRANNANGDEIPSVTGVAEAMTYAPTRSADAGSVQAKLNTIITRVGTATITVVNPMTSDGINYQITLVAGDDYTESLDCAFEFATADWWPSIDAADTIKMTIKEGGTVVIPAFEVADWSDADGVTVELLTATTKLLTNPCEKAYSFDLEATIGGLYKTLARGYITALADRTAH